MQRYDVENRTARDRAPLRNRGWALGAYPIDLDIARMYDTPVRIESIDTVAVGIPEYADLVMVVVRTDEGVSGVGEATLEGQSDAVLAVLAALGRELINKDPSRIQHLWQSLYRDPFWRPGPIRLSAMSGIEQALWDIKGKVANLAVFDLLGGACRDEIPLYANSPVGATPEELAESAVGIVERGFDAMKLAAPDATLSLDTPGSLRNAVARCEAIRAAVGDDVALAVDLHGRLSPAMAIAFAQAVADLGIWFLGAHIPGGTSVGRRCGARDVDSARNGRAAADQVGISGTCSNCAPVRWCNPTSRIVAGSSKPASSREWPSPTALA